MASTSQNYRKLRAWIQLDGLNNYIPGTNCYKAINVIPQGHWIQLPKPSCCASLDSYVIIRNTVDDPITAIVSNNTGTINLTGLNIGLNGYLVVPLPNGYDYNLTITTTTFSGRTFTNTTLNGGLGVITGTGALASNNTVITTTAVPGQNYLVVLS